MRYIDSRRQIKMKKFFQTKILYRKATIKIDIKMIINAFDLKILEKSITSKMSLFSNSFSEASL